MLDPVNTKTVTVITFLSGRLTTIVHFKLSCQYEENSYGRRTATSLYKPYATSTGDVRPPAQHSKFCRVVSSAAAAL